MSSTIEQEHLFGATISLIFFLLFALFKFLASSLSPLNKNLVPQPHFNKVFSMQVETEKRKKVFHAASALFKFSCLTTAHLSPPSSISVCVSFYISLSLFRPHTPFIGIFYGFISDARGKLLAKEADLQCQMLPPRSSHCLSLSLSLARFAFLSVSQSVSGNISMSASVSAVVFFFLTCLFPLPFSPLPRPLSLCFYLPPSLPLLTVSCRFVCCLSIWPLYLPLLLLQFVLLSFFKLLTPLLLYIFVSVDAFLAPSQSPSPSLSLSLFLPPSVRSHYFAWQLYIFMLVFPFHSFRFLLHRRLRLSLLRVPASCLLPPASPLFITLLFLFGHPVELPPLRHPLPFYFHLLEWNFYLSAAISRRRRSFGLIPCYQILDTAWNLRGH